MEHGLGFQSLPYRIGSRPWFIWPFMFYLVPVLILGIFNAWVRGDDIFGLFHLPKYGSFTPGARHALSERVVRLHRLAANALLILAGGHGAVGLYHFAVLRDPVFQRMLWLKR